MPHHDSSRHRSPDGADPSLTPARRVAATGPARIRIRPLLAASVAAFGVALVSTVVMAAAAVIPSGPPVATGRPAVVPVSSAAGRADPGGAPGGASGPDSLTTPCSPTVRACVQLSTQHVWLLEGGRVTRDGFVSSGTTDMETPTGDFRVQYKDATHYSSEYHTPMPWAVFFDTHGDALHQGSLARQSRGCVHLTPDDAVAFFDALRPGDEVQILP